MQDKTVRQVLFITSMLGIHTGCSSESNPEQSTATGTGGTGENAIASSNATVGSGGSGAADGQGGTGGQGQGGQAQGGEAQGGQAQGGQGGSGGCAPPTVGVCGRTFDGIHCGISDNIGGFINAMLWNGDPSDANGWDSDQSLWTTIEYPDVNGDGKADYCGRGAAGIYCGVSNGSAFLGPQLWSTYPSDANGWDSHPSYYRTIRFPDINGDGKADYCGRSAAGIYCGISNGATFINETLWNNDLSDAQAWDTDPSYWATIRFPDVNGDGKADLCARSSVGIICGISNGITFVGLGLWNGNPSDANAWDSDPSYWATIQFPDINGDGKADYCGRGAAGVYCGLSNGTSQFSNEVLWTNAPSDGNSWNVTPSYWATIQFPDINGDGKADFCGRGGAGLYCGISDGVAFNGVTLWNGNPSDAAAWYLPEYWPSIRFPDVNSDGKADYCGRGAGGIYCGISDGVSFVGPQLWSPDFSDANGWSAEPSRFLTIRFPTMVNGNCSP